VVAARVRERIERQARPLLSYYSFGFAEELLLHQRLFGVSEKQLFSATGTSHLLSISGLHLSLIFAIASALAGLLLRERRIGRLLLPLLATFSYLAFIDFPLSADRAFVMLCVFTVAQVSGSHHGTLESLSWAALVLALLDPLSVFDIGLQLSLASVAGLAFIGRPLAKLAHSKIHVVPGVVSSVCSTTGASIATAALVVSTFHVFTPVSLVANLVAIPAVSILLMLMLSWIMALLVVHPLAVLVAPLVNVVSDVIIWFLRLCSRLPGSHFNVAAPPSFVLWSTGALFAMVILIVDNRPRLGPKARGASIAAACAGLMLCTWPLWTPATETCVTFPVVDQGGAVLVRDRNIGTWLCLIDSTASSMNRAARAVAALGVTRPDAVVLSGCPTDMPTQLDILFEVLAPTRVYVPSDSMVASLPGLDANAGATVRHVKRAQSIVATRGATTIHINGSDGTMSLETSRVAGTVGPGTPAPARAPGFSYDTVDRTLLVRTADTMQSFQSDQAGCVTLRLTRSACQVAPDSRR
jgi:competence protein ComEC